MKKFIPILIFIFTFCFIPNVKADTIIESINLGSFGDNELSLLSQPFNCPDSKCSLSDAYSNLLDVYNNNYKSLYPYYVIAVDNFYITHGSTTGQSLFMYLFKDLSYTFDSSSSVLGYQFGFNPLPSESKIITSSNYSTLFNTQFNYLYLFNHFSSDTNNMSFYYYFDSNFDIMSNSSFEIRNFYSDSNLIIDNNKPFPKIKDLVNYTSWDDYHQNNLKGYTEVNLDNYHSILLTLKDYSQTKAFDVNLPVKGQVGITPVYDYGQSEKPNITDRCNINYKDFTDYRLYILDSDLKNNALYYVKECSSGSSIKVDTSIFNITYVTDDNVNDPVVTVGGKDYHVIPFDQLSNTANKNEENGFIPGETSSNSLADIINNTTDTLSSVWGSITTFMSLVTKFFNVLPIEIRTIAITTFLTSCTLGIIKIIRA